MEPSGKGGICTIDSAIASPSVLNRTIGDSCSVDPLEHGPSLRNVRPLMSRAQFSRRRNSLSTKISLITMRDAQKSNDVKIYHHRCHDPPEMELQANPVHNEDELDLNRTAPARPEETTWTMDESKRVLVASQEFLASRHFPKRKGKELCGHDWTKRVETMTNDGTEVHASDSVDGGDREPTNFPETSRQISVERPSFDASEVRGFTIFSELFQSLDRAIKFLEQNEVWKLDNIAHEISAKMDIGPADCLRAQLAKTREMIEPRLAVASSGPEFNLRGTPTISHITNKALCISPPGLSERPQPNSPNITKCRGIGSMIISPIHSGTSTSPNDSSHRKLPDSMNEDEGSPGRKEIQRTLKLCTPTTGTTDRFSERPSTNRDSRQIPDTQMPTLESTPRRLFGNQSVSRNRSLNVMPVGVHNSNSGTTCYINAGLQLLASVPEILFRVDEGIQFRIMEGGPEMEACVAYKKFMEDREREFSKPNKKTSAIQNNPIADLMFKIYPDKFKPCKEEDCVEFVTLLLLKIHEELKEVHSPSVLFTGALRRFRTEASLATGMEYDRINSNSPHSAKEEFNVIPLHFTSQHERIEDSFVSYTTEERSSDGEFLHWCKFEVLPPLLLIHVQSYDDSKPIPQKVLREVPIDEILQFRQEWMVEAPRATEIPVPSDDGFGILISDYLEDAGALKQVFATPPRYLLRSVVFHDGNRTTTGHYTAAVFLPGRYGQRVWYYCDDHYVKEYSRKALNQRAKTSQVTLMLYERDC